MLNERRYHLDQAIDKGVRAGIFGLFAAIIYASATKDFTVVSQSLVPAYQQALGVVFSTLTVVDGGLAVKHLVQAAKRLS